ncbi:MAG TPA: septum formation initiator family protein [Dehalococcoidia bacterium]|nr:septum formation initiator family protein [Dehalococcoidia bacterium]
MRILRLFSPGRLLLAAIGLVTLYMLVTAGSNYLHSYRLANDEERLTQEVEELQRQQDQLTQIRDYLRTDEYVEFMARRVFGLVKPGEKLVIVQAPTPEPQDGPEDATWWQRLFGGSR